MTHIFETDEDYLQHFKEYIEGYSEEIEDYVNRCMTHDGLTSESSQRLCIINALKELDACVSGTTVDDLNINVGED